MNAQTFCALFLIFTAFVLIGWVSGTTNVGKRYPASTVCKYERIIKHNISGWMVDCSHRHLNNVPKDFPTPTLILNLNGNNITTISDNDFRTLEFLFELYLSNNIIQKMDSRAFKNLKRLLVLDLQENKLPMDKPTYDPDVFKYLTNLSVLFLNGNIKSSEPSYQYPSRALSYLTKLNTLYLDGLFNKTFGKNMSKLKYLTNLVMNGENGFCNIEYINADFFVSLPHLEFIDLRECFIKEIHKSAFTNLQHIATLDLSGNMDLGFGRLAVGLKGLQDSKTLNRLNINNMYSATHVGVRIQCSYFKWLKNSSLVHLELDSNAIEFIDNEVVPFCFPQMIKYLSVRRNRFLGGLYELQMIQQPNLEFIDISDQIAKHDQLITYTSFGKNLRTILLNSNGINIFRGPIVGLQNIERLELGNNYCTHMMNNVFDYGTSLQILNLTGNLLTFDLEADTNGQLFKNLSDVRILVLSRNRIEKLPINVLQGLKSLQHLDLGNNRMIDWKVNVTHMSNLTTLDLSNNEISSLDSSSTYELDKIGRRLKLNLSGNPFECSCRTLDFLRWLQFPNIRLVNLSEYKCSCVNGTEKICHLSNIDSIIRQLHLECTSYVPYILGGGSCLIILILFVTILVVRKYRWRLTYLYYLSNAKYGGYYRLGEFKRDAYVSYADKDVEYVINKLIPELEESRGVRLCVRDREFLPGVAIAENITNWIHACKHTIVVLSENFIERKWCKFEFNIARMDDIYTNRDVITLIIHNAVDEDKLPPEIKEFKILNRGSVLIGEECEMFWDTLADAIHA